jgi:hypothetical protein
VIRCLYDDRDFFWVILISDRLDVHLLGHHSRVTQSCRILSSSLSSGSIHCLDDVPDVTLCHHTPDRFHRSLPPALFGERVVQTGSDAEFLVKNQHTTNACRWFIAMIFENDASRTRHCVLALTGRLFHM